MSKIHNVHFILRINYENNINNQTHSIFVDITYA